jgi:hypothetical protein
VGRRDDAVDADEDGVDEQHERVEAARGETTALMSPLRLRTSRRRGPPPPPPSHAGYRHTDQDRGEASARGRTGRGESRDGKDVRKPNLQALQHVEAVVPH